MLKIIINYNKKIKKWSIYINKYLFVVIKFVRKRNLKYSIIFVQYMLLLQILKQFGLIKSLINKRNYVFI